jgi:hypothetical protein
MTNKLLNGNIEARIDVDKAENKVTGRRPLILNQAIQDKIVDAILGGNYLETAAQFAGVSRATLFDWLAKGREAQAQIQKEQELIPNGQLYADFLDAVESAQARAEVQAVASLRKAGLEHWQATAWWLERSRPRKYGRLERTEITGAEGGPIAVDLNVERNKALELLAAMKARSNDAQSS